MPRHAVGPAIRETRPAQCRGYGSSPHRSHRRWIRSWAASEEGSGQEEGDEAAARRRPVSFGDRHLCCRFGCDNGPLLATLEQGNY